MFWELEFLVFCVLVRGAFVNLICVNCGGYDVVVKWIMFIVCGNWQECMLVVYFSVVEVKVYC